jgi:hypothetical protein
MNIQFSIRAESGIFFILGTTEWLKKRNMYGQFIMPSMR